jgi:pimeloyl-ACP methyl ester carboxylesterase
MPRRPRAKQTPTTGDTTEPRIVRRGDTRIAYQVFGEGGPPVLMVQPFWVGIDAVRNDAAMFGPQLSGGHRLIVHDRRGTGASDRRPGRVQIDEQVDDIVAILDDIGVNRVFVVAIAEGACVAVHLAAERPERVARMVLIDPHLRPRVGPGSTMLLHTLHSRPRVGLKAFARSLVEDDRAGEALAEAMSARLDAPTAARLYEAFLQADALAATSSVPARTLLAFGVHDRMVVEEEARELQAQFPAAYIGLVQGTPGTQAAAREAWIQVQNFLTGAAAGDADAADAAASVRPLAVRRARDGGVSDYVPSGPPPQTRVRAAPSSSASLGAQQPLLVRWGPPAEVPREAVEMNRKAVDLILLGQIEEALDLFRKTIELAPDYDDAQINYRELLSRLVQRRVAQWQTQQAEAMLSEAGRQAARYAKRAKRFSLGRLFRPTQARA